MISSDVSAGNQAKASEYNNLRLDLTPIGAIIPFAGTSVPAGAGWLLCYGQAVSRTTYADLFTAIGTTWGVGDGSTTFNLPDMRGRFPLGKDNMGGSSADRVTHANADALGSAQGAETTDVSHTHTVTSTKDEPNNTNAGLRRYVGTPTTDGTVTSSAMSANSTPNVMNPYLTLNYIIKY